jgi:hypothetical protein
MSERIHYEETDFGFRYGAAHVERMMSDEKKGWVTISIRTPKRPHGKEIQVYVTRTGKVRIHSSGVEWFPAPMGDR